MLANAAAPAALAAWLEQYVVNMLQVDLRQMVCFSLLLCAGHGLLPVAN